MIQEYFVFNMQKCSDDIEVPGYPEGECTTETEMNDFLEQVGVETWSIQEKIYFEKRF